METTAPARPVGPNGVMSRHYFDENGRRHRVDQDVPVNVNGELVHRGFVCRRCTETRWFPAQQKGVPVCPVHGDKMRPVKLKPPPLLPYRDVWAAVKQPLRPVGLLAGLAVTGVAVDGGNVPAWQVLLATPVVAFAVKTWMARREVKAAEKRGALDADDPQDGLRLRRKISRRARNVGLAVGGAGVWVVSAAALGLDGSTVAGDTAWWLLPVAWGIPAALQYRRWRMERRHVPAPVFEEVVEEPAPAQGPRMDERERIARLRWGYKISQQIGDMVADDSGQMVPAERPGRLAGARLEHWHPIEGGWAATIVGPIGAYGSDEYLASRAAIAKAMSMKASMITIIPDDNDENIAQVMAQRTSPISGTVYWGGPDEIDPVKGTAPFARYKDGTWVDYEIYRPGWGNPHAAFFGTTGSGKSDALNLVFAIDRWAHFTDEAGQTKGMVASFLIDPQQGQSFAPFLDHLAAPVATSLDEAILMVEVLTQEMLRRNKYLSRVEYVNERGRKRRGRKWWNPLIDGPIITLTIDEAHDFLSDRKFSTLVTKAARMWRKCGGQIRIATHTPLLQDLGGSMALRDMLTGAFVWVGRTANSLSSAVAFNGRLPSDSRQIPEIPGTAFIMAGPNPKPMMARTAFCDDYYNWVLDPETDEPIGYPAVLPPETWKAFGPDFAAWVEHATSDPDGEWSPSTSSSPVKAAPKMDERAVDAVIAVLLAADGPLDMGGLDAGLAARGSTYTTATVRDVLKRLRAADQLAPGRGSYELTPTAREELSTSLDEPVAA